MKVPIRVAVMGCVVNGPGEAREADLGIAAGKGQGFLVVRGEVVDKIPEDRFVDRLLEEARKIAAERASDDGVGDDGAIAGPVIPEPAVFPSKA
jgi:(E)-4-hydroxy-3-methylbut-2-enyl-diphosphate synthase